MIKKLLMLGVALLAFGCLAWAAEKTYSGVVSDSNCGMKHAKGGDEIHLDRVREVHPLFRGDCALVLEDGTKLRLSRSRRKAFEAMFAQVG